MRAVDLAMELQCRGIKTSHCRKGVSYVRFINSGTLEGCNQAWFDAM